MKNNVIKSLILLFIFFANQAYSNTINAIKFIGLNNTTENTLIKYVPFKIGDKYSDSVSNETIQSLFKTDLFSDISIINNDGVVNITVLENPTIKYFEFNLDSESGFSNWLKNEKKLLFKAFQRRYRQSELAQELEKDGYEGVAAARWT